LFTTRRTRVGAAVTAAALLAGGTAAALTTPASASPNPAGKHTPEGGHHPALSIKRFDLNGYVINADYSLGRNTGNTFQQTYADSTVQGVPIAGPDVGLTFPREDYVAIPIGNHELYVTWLDPGTYAIVDVFVMNFATHTVYDYAPGSATPESAGTIAVVHRGAQRVP
jgi:hypothetical protein